jgi:hypothetical protein
MAIWRLRSEQVTPRARSWLAQGVVTGFLIADFFHLTRIEQRAEQIHRTLPRDWHGRPDLRRGQTAVVAQELQQPFLVGAQRQFPGGI